MTYVAFTTIRVVDLAGCSILGYVNFVADACSEVHSDINII